MRIKKFKYLCGMFSKLYHPKKFQIATLFHKYLILTIVIEMMILSNGLERRMRDTE